MNTMNMPGFTADSSIYKTTVHYHRSSLVALRAPEIHSLLQLQLQRRPVFSNNCGICQCDPGYCC